MRTFWHCYELSWLKPGGLPRIGVLTLRVPCTSPATVESKSLKLYLNGFAHTVFDSADAVAATIEADLSALAGAPVTATISQTPDTITDFTSYCLDGLDVRDVGYTAPDPTLLIATGQDGADAVHTHLFRSICPITGQPDWASVALAWRGRHLDRTGVLRYLVSYREAAAFHEDVVERIFADIRQAAAKELTVDGRFLRRGGIELNPYRSTVQGRAPAIRLWRQ